MNVRGSYTSAVGLRRAWWSAVSSTSASVLSPAERGGGLFGAAAYWAAKAAELGFARALARELGPNGVTVNAVAPASSKPTSAAVRLQANVSQLVAQIPVGRGGGVNDVADLIAFLCREESS